MACYSYSRGWRACVGGVLARMACWRGYCIVSFILYCIVNFVLYCIVLFFLFVCFFFFYSLFYIDSHCLQQLYCTKQYNNKDRRVVLYRGLRACVADVLAWVAQVRCLRGWCASVGDICGLCVYVCFISIWRNIALYRYKIQLKLNYKLK